MGKHHDYTEAVKACIDDRYIRKSLTEIALEFGHKPENFLVTFKRKYRDIFDKRNSKRKKLGLKGGKHGPSPRSKQKYLPALQLLQTVNITMEQAAKMTGVPHKGTLAHIYKFHKELVVTPRKKRKEAGQTPNLRYKEPKPEMEKYYEEAILLISSHPEISIRQVAIRTGLVEHSLRWYLSRWHQDLLDKRLKWKQWKKGQKHSKVPKNKLTVEIT